MASQSDKSKTKVDKLPSQVAMLEVQSPHGEKYVTAISGYGARDIVFNCTIEDLAGFSFMPKHIFRHGILRTEIGEEFKFPQAVVESAVSSGDHIEITLKVIGRPISFGEVQNSEIIDDNLEAIPIFKPDKINEHRKSSRIEIREGEGLLAEIKSPHLKTAVKTRVYDVSSVGMSLELEDSEKDTPIEILRTVSVLLRVGQNRSYNLECDVVWVTEAKGAENRKIGLRINTTPPDSKLIANRGIRFDEHFRLKGVTYKEHFYLETAKIEIKEISKKTARVILLGSETLVFEGMNLEIAFFIQTRTEKKIHGRILHVVGVEKNRAEVIIEITDFPKELEADLVNYIIQFTNYTPNHIREAGFKIAHISNAFRFRQVHTHEEYLEVLRLRLKTYKVAGKVPEDTKVEDLVAPLDHMSRILTIYHLDQLVASVALTFPDTNDLILDTERALEDGYPKNFPPKTDFMEVSRLCTHPDYRRGDLLLRVFEHVYRVFYTSDRKRIVTSTDKKLWNIYKKIGFRKAPVGYHHPTLDNIWHDIIYIDIEAGIYGKDVSSLTWNYVYRDMTGYLMDRSNLKHTLFQKIRFYFMRAIGFVFRISIKPRY